MKSFLIQNLIYFSSVKNSGMKEMRGRGRDISGAKKSKFSDEKKKTKAIE
jgi:hypothetical protein